MNLRGAVFGVGSGGRRNEVKTIRIYEKVTCKMSRKHKSYLRNIFTKEMIIRRKGVSIGLLFGNWSPRLCRLSGRVLCFQLEE